MLDYKQALKAFFPGTCFETWWIGASLTFVSVKNKLNLNQDIVSTQNDQTIFGALNRPEIAFNKFFNQNKNSGPADIRLRLGTKFYTETIFKSYTILTLHFH